jgi:hypothetical protein
MDIIKANWDWIASNPWGFVALSALIFGAGWGFAKLFYGERIELLKAQIASTSKGDSKTGPETNFRYKPHGRHGRNLLAGTTHEAIVEEDLSLQANIPDGKKLHIVLYGPPPQSISETSGAWYFSVMGVNNWTASTYQESTSGCIQHFNAEEGAAEMQFHFARPGQVRIEAFEGEDKTATWSKILHVNGNSGA